LQPEQTFEVIEKLLGDDVGNADEGIPPVDELNIVGGMAGGVIGGGKLLVDELEGIDMPGAGMPGVIFMPPVDELDGKVGDAYVGGGTYTG